MCLNGNGTEVLEAGYSVNYPKYLTINPCVRTSTTSMLLLSVGKRLVADALAQNTTANSTGVHSGRHGSATNMRKIYSFTVGRLSWTLTNIAETFGAKCNVSGVDTSKCQGLALPLNTTSRVASPQQLVVRAGALPMPALLPPLLNNLIAGFVNRQRPLTLVQVNESTRQLEPAGWYDAVAGDILLPHNVRRLAWDQSHANPGSMCVVAEERVQRVLDNHMYIEHPFQATYTAALFYLLQNAVVKDAITTYQSTTMLAFNGNTQEVALLLSTPSTNALLTQLGCLLLSHGVAASIAWATIVRNATSRPNWLTGITNAEVIARAKLAEKTFPPLLLHRYVTHKRDTSIESRELDDLVIHYLLLQLRDADQAGGGDRTGITEDAGDSSSSISLSVHT